MLEFDYQSPDDVESAIAIASAHAGSRYLGGGTNLVDLMREEIERPRMRSM